jgi:fructuronate reductase
MDEAVTYPSCVVDRIVPASTDADRATASATLGMSDALAVGGEPYRQWVIQDSFLTDRPAWELAGAIYVADVAPYQMTKLRLLNGAHSALAYLGLATGYTTVSGVMAAPWGAGLVRAFAREVAPSLPPGGPDPRAYADDLVTRFENPAMSHQLRQIGTDGSLKIPYRLLQAVRELRAGGKTTAISELAVAAWVLATRPGSNGGQRWGTSDPQAERLAACWTAGGPPGDTVASLLSLVGADDLAATQAFRRAVADHLPALTAGRVELPPVSQS